VNNRSPHPKINHLNFGIQADDDQTHLLASPEDTSRKIGFGSKIVLSGVNSSYSSKKHPMRSPEMGSTEQTMF
jgi:hypothetical protein